MTHECLVKLLEVVDGLVKERVEPCPGEAFKSGREHEAFGDVGSTVKIQRGLEARDVVIGVDRLAIPFPRYFQAGKN